jgi:O-antigen ligase
LIGWLFAIALASYIRGGVRHIVPLVAAGLAGVVMIVVLQTAGLSVPLPAQRALSFIPISWDSRASLDAKGSVDWRVDMWRLALTSDRYIKNKVLGDGFGFDPAELRAQTTLTSFRMDTSYGLQDYYMITGDYHSGPVSAIRFVGYIGLFLFTALLIANAKYAWKIIESAKKTAFFPLALYSGIAAIYHPICFWLIFGGYGGDFVQAILTLGMLNLIDRSIKKEKANKVVDETGKKA